jgi:predicted enzyme related to lactoylglutathione lyase
MIGIGGGAENHEAQICYKVSDIAAAITRVRDHGGRAGEPAQQPYGLLAECTDDQGITFHLWQPTG